MITGHLFLAFILASTILALIPGPNVALITANSVAYGPRYGLLTVAGTTAAMLPQLTLVALGMAAVLDRVAYLFEWLRWAGVAYLVYLGLKNWFETAPDLSGKRPEPKSLRAIFLRGFLVSLTNPKTLFFFGAFFPQFIDPSLNHNMQIVRLCVTFLIVAIVIDSGWALGGGYARGLLIGRERLLQRLTGTLLLAAGLGLALARRR